ncbi:MAG TPA: hypothetical protein PLH91_02050 [Tenuifilaceae bacterium]|nr:hypothetical protein [Tenuifilaceae bacterium]HPI43988.1 hypothetical protein [Tenuifilaceae bacterium]HPN21112.1 hypothetical protein [Tenuifilaceae bacterium]HPV56680.1 hypothetical protein [Tenuifilaceae bacterium]
MKKVLAGALLLLLSHFGYSQTVSDQAVVPVSVTLNAILRLTVTSGGNIVFVVNTVDQYTNGIATSPRTTTTFRVSSTRNFTVTMVPENNTHFVGIQTNNTTNFPITNVGIVCAGTSGVVIPAAVAPLLATQTIVTSPAAANASYTIGWELATNAVVGASTLLSQSIPADVYVNNMFLTLAPQ